MKISGIDLVLQSQLDKGTLKDSGNHSSIWALYEKFTSTCKFSEFNKIRSVGLHCKEVRKKKRIL